MIKDNFQISEKEPTVCKTQVSLLLRENYLEKSESKEKPQKNFDETIYSKSVFIEERTSFFEKPLKEATKTSFSQIQGQILVYRPKSNEPEEYPLKLGITYVGRGQENQIIIDDKKASRRHFFIEVKPDCVELIDLSSENGTKVNGDRVNKCFLNDNDSICLGKTVLVFRSFLQGQRALTDHRPQDERAKLSRNALTKKSKSVLARNYDFINTTGVIFFFVIATSCLILGGAMVGRIVMHANVIKIFQFHEILHHASHVAAFGNIAEAKNLLYEAERLAQVNNLRTHEIILVESFINTVETVSEADKLAFAGKYQTALLKLKEIKFVNLSKNESIYVKEAIKMRFKTWQVHIKKPNILVKKKIKKTTVKLKPVAVVKKAEPNVLVSDQWKTAINLYKSGNIKHSCHLVKKLMSHGDPNWSQKAHTFWTRKCAS